MPQDLNDKSHPEDGRINVNKSDDVDYWTTKLKVTSQLLLSAVMSAGPRVDDVKEWLKTHGHIS